MKYFTVYLEKPNDVKELYELLPWRSPSNGTKHWKIYSAWDGKFYSDRCVMIYSDSFVYWEWKTPEMITFDEWKLVQAVLK